jgi:hypothetical protein
MSKYAAGITSIDSMGAVIIPPSGWHSHCGAWPLNHGKVTAKVTANCLPLLPLLRCHPDLAFPADSGVRHAAFERQGLARVDNRGRGEMLLELRESEKRDRRCVSQRPLRGPKDPSWSAQSVDERSSMQGGVCETGPSGIVFQDPTPCKRGESARLRHYAADPIGRTCASVQNADRV